MKPRRVIFGFILMLALTGVLLWRLPPEEKSSTTATASVPTPAQKNAVESPKLPATVPTPTTKDIFAEATANLRKLLADSPKSPENMTQNDFASLANSLAEQDIRGALKWVQNLPGDIPINVKNNIVFTIVEFWAKADPAAAAAFALSHNQNQTSDFNMLAIQVASIWAQQDYQAELAWAESLPPSATRDDTIGASLSQMAKIDAPAAWNYVVGYIQTNPNFDGFSSIIDTWSNTDLAAAAKAIAALPEGAMTVHTPGVASLLITKWIAHDPEAAAQWVDNLPAGSLHDASAARLNQLQQAKALLNNAGGGIMMMTGQTVMVAPSGSAPIVIPLHPENPDSGTGQ